MTRPAVLLLVRHAPTASTRRGAFPSDEPLDDRGARDAAALAGHLRADRAVTAPSSRCVATARLAGFPDAAVDARLGELDFGRWAGSTFRQALDADPGGVRSWLADPSLAPTGGEPLAALADRVAAALRDHAVPGSTTAVFTSGGPVKLAVLRALGAPDRSVWNLDVAPCSISELHRRDDGGWTVRSVNASVAAPEDALPPVPVGVGHGMRR